MGLIREPKNVDLVVAPSKSSTKDLREMDTLIKAIKAGKVEKSMTRKEKSGRKTRCLNIPLS